MLIAKEVTFEYKGKQVLRFQYPNITTSTDDPLLILGQSGTGKTTLLHILAGLMKPSGGIVEVNGTDIYAYSEKKRDSFRGNHIGIIYQQHHFMKSLTVLENICLAQYAVGAERNTAKALQWLEQLGLADKAQQKTMRLSQGEQQRVAIIRSLMNDPKLILADEPTSSLDNTSAAEVYDLLVNQARNIGAALVVVTHDNRLKIKCSNQILLDGVKKVDVNV